MGVVVRCASIDTRVHFAKVELATEWTEVTKNGMQYRYT